VPAEREELVEPPMEFGILGPLEVRNGEAPVRVPGAKERALLAEQALEGFRAVGDRRGGAYLQFVLGMAARFQGRLEEAGGRYQEALAAAREAGPPGSPARR
jgi:hypothetical protein